MNRTTKFLVPASLAISTYCPKVYNRTIPYRFLHIDIKPKLCAAEVGKINKKNPFKMDQECSVIDEKTEDLNKMLDNLKLEYKIENSTDNNIDSNSTKINKKKSLTPAKYKEIRKWELINGKKCTVNKPENWFEFRLVSFNILAQNLLDTYEYLYTKHDVESLPWEKRKPLIIKEILKADADVICLQEMEEEHLDDFCSQFHELGYGHLYKKRTNDKKDGLLLLFRENIFKLSEFSKVELHQKGTELLSRDNVGIIAKFALKNDPQTKVVVATTHLLYNPRRNDVRLGQVQILLAEIERIAYVRETPTGPEYLPVILTGDFNLEPHSGVYKFIIEGSIEYSGKGRNLENSDYRCLTNTLIPPYLHVTDECQHFNVLTQRLKGKRDGKVMLRNIEAEENLELELNPSNSEKPVFDSHSQLYQKVKVAEGHYVTFSSGLLTHPFIFHSVYTHVNENGSEATTFQNEWITVDYIFYSDDIKAIQQYTLPTAEECSKYLDTIPNSVVGSDHLCLGSTFRLRRKK